ncbi:hypothetical protein ACWIEX_23540 [Bosea sp. NPDC055353]
MARRKAEAARHRASFPAIDKAIDTVLTRPTSRPSDFGHKTAMRFSALGAQPLQTA